MLRRVMIHFIGLLAAIMIGVWTVREFLQQQSPIAGIFVIVAFIFISQVAAYALSGREASVRTAPLPEVPLLRGSETWGWLRPASGVGAGFPLNRDRIQIGRGVDMDITLNNASISRHHAELKRLMDGALLRDAGSRNGVFVNGERVQEQLLSDGDNVGLGEMRFIFVQVRAQRAATASQEVEPATLDGAQMGRPAQARGDAWRSGEVAQARGAGRGPADAESRDDARPFDDTSDFTVD